MTDPRSLPYLLLRVVARPFDALESLISGEAARRAAGRLDLEARLDTAADDLADDLFRAAGPKDPKSGPDAAQARLAVVALRRDVHNRRRPDAETLRTARPKLNVEVARSLDDWAALRKELESAGETVEHVFLRELQDARRALAEQAREPTFALGVRLASRALYAGLEHLGRPETWRHDERLAAASLIAYLDRAATKTSPHGLFCATAPARWTGDGSAAVDGENRLDRWDVLLHVTEARKVAATVGSRRAAWPALVPRINPTLHTADDGLWQLWRPASLAREDDEEILRRMPPHPVAEAVLETIRENDGLALPDLIRSVAETTAIPEDDLTDFVARLQDIGLISGEIEIPYTCRRPLAFVVERMKEAGCEPPWLDRAEALEIEVADLAERHPAEIPNRLDDVAARLEDLPHVRPLEPDGLVRVDAASGLDVALPSTILDDLRATLSRYARLYGALYPRRELRRGLARDFVATHGADVDVPLPTVYRGAPGRHLGPKARPSGFPRPPTGETHSAFERIRDAFASWAREARSAGKDQVVLTDAELDELTGDTPEPPWAAGVLFQVAAASPDDVSAGRYRLVVNDLFTGAGLSLARFAFLHGRPVVDELRRAVRRMGREGAVLAEVTFNHWGRAANAGLRVPFLEHEIELLGERASPGKTVIPWAELRVRWDTGEDLFVLTWPRDPEEAVEVIPVVSSGVSPEGFISLLIAIGRQAIQPLSLFPGFEAEGVTYWPRFVHGRTVLFRQRWIFRPDGLPEMPGGSGNPDRLLAAYFVRLQRFRSRHDLPRNLFVHTDREPKPQHVDFDSPLDADRLRRLLSPDDDGSSPTLYATEMLPGPSELWVRDARGRYAAEFLAQMYGGPWPTDSPDLPPRPMPR